MRTALASVAALASLAVGTPAPQDMAQAAGPTPQHEWLLQLVGEWVVRSEASMEPGAEPESMDSTQSVRAIGKLWIQMEGHAMVGETPLTTLLTLGYDPDQEAFVGTWIDSMQTHLWTYRGRLDEERRTLTLETEGPGFGDPQMTSRYRDRIERTGPDSWVLTSSVELEDGTWTEFLRSEARLKP